MFLSEADEKALEHVFTYHPADEGQRKDCEQIRTAARTFAREILSVCKPCADRSAALRKVREAVMTANAAIALDGKSF